MSTDYFIRRFRGYAGRTPGSLRGQHQAGRTTLLQANRHGPVAGTQGTAAEPGIAGLAPPAPAFLLLRRQYLGR